MNIKEAIDKALPEGLAITREDWKIEGETKHYLYVLPTNSTARMILHNPEYEGLWKTLCCWQPSAKDLQAVDWKVVKPIDKSISGIEILND